MKKIIFTDLDGTLLHPLTYSYEEALGAINLLKRKEIPIIFCSAKTRAEQEVYRKELGIEDPFVVENGGAIFIPEGYFPLTPTQKVVQNYRVIELGASYEKIRGVLKGIEREIGLEIKGFGDMSAEEVAKDTGLDLESAKLAKQREYSETLKLEGPEGRIRLILIKIRERGLDYFHGGRYYEVGAGNDKGKATQILSHLFRQKFGDIETIGIGDSQNDLPMLAVVDIPVLVQKPNNRWEDLDLANIRKVEGVGPRGWSRAIQELVGSKDRAL